MNNKLIAGSVAGMLLLGTACLMLSFFIVALYSTTTYALSVDVAELYGTATANRYYKDYTAPDFAIDGQRDTGWISGGHASTNNPDWLTIDLGSLYLVNSIDLLWFEPNGRYANYTVNYNLYYGLDNTDWVFVGSGIFVDETPQITDHFDFAPSGQSMRYVKYEVTGGSHWSSIAEINVWADDRSSSSSVPEPASMLLLGFGLLGLGSMKRIKKRGKSSGSLLRPAGSKTKGS